MPLYPTLSDHFGRHYILLTPRHNRRHHALQAEIFSSTAHALRFVRQLRVPVDFWRRLYLEAVTSMQTAHDETSVLHSVSQMLHRGTIQACRVDSVTDTSGESVGFSDDDRTHYALKPVNFVLLNRPDELKHFADESEAIEFLNQSDIEEAKLKELIDEENLSTGKDTHHTIAKALVAGSLIVIVSRYTRPPKTTESSFGSDPVTDKAAGLGPPPDEFKEISLDLIDQFDNSLGSAFTSLFDGVEYTLKTDLGEEHKGTIQNGKINIPKAKMNSSFDIKFKDLPAFMEG